MTDTEVFGAAERSRTVFGRRTLPQETALAALLRLPAGARPLADLVHDNRWPAQR